MIFSLCQQSFYNSNSLEHWIRQLHIYVFNILDYSSIVTYLSPWTNCISLSLAHRSSTQFVTVWFIGRLFQSTLRCLHMSGIWIWRFVTFSRTCWFRRGLLQFFCISRLIGNYWNMGSKSFSINQTIRSLEFICNNLIYLAVIFYWLLFSFCNSDLVQSILDIPFRGLFHLDI